MECVNSNPNRTGQNRIRSDLLKLNLRLNDPLADGVFHQVRP